MDGITQPIYDDTMLKLAWSCLGRLAEANYSVLAHLRPNIMSSLLRVAEAIPDNIKVPFDTSLKVLAGAISIVKACVANGSAHAEELFLFTQTLRYAGLKTLFYGVRVLNGHLKVGLAGTFGAFWFSANTGRSSC
jgi:hypothetical protein